MSTPDTPPPDKISGPLAEPPRLSFWSELKERKVVRVGITYAVVAWVIIQVASVTFGGFGIPPWAFRFVVLVLLGGFPLALVLAWAFEVTPQGLRLTRTVRQAMAETLEDGKGAKANEGRRNLAAVAFAAGLPTLLFGALAVYFYFQAARPSGGTESPAAIASGRAVAPDRSIAVLPFRNMSAEPGNEYFCDGVQEDILTFLANLAELQVVSRTSVLQYRDTAKTIPEIGRELGVAFILEGSVQRAGQRVRVTGQLIEAATDRHLWARSFDRELHDIFAIQSELAREIATSLQAAISPREAQSVAERGTRVPAAYDLVLKGRARLEAIRVDEEAVREIEALFRSATELDSGYVEAWTRLANVRVKAYFWNFDPTPEALARAREALDRAVALAPEDPAVITEQGHHFYYGHRDYTRAREFYRRATALSPSNADVLSALGFIARREGKFAESLAYLEQAFALDPRNISLATMIAQIKTSGRRFEEAREAWRRARILAPDEPWIGAMQGWVTYYAEGSWTALEDWFDRQDEALLASDPIQRDLYLNYLLGRGALERYLALTAPAETEGEDASRVDIRLNRAWVFHELGETARAEGILRALEAQFRAELTLNPRNVEQLLALAAVEALLGRSAAALETADRARAMMPETLDAVAGVTISERRAMVMIFVGHLDEAMVEIERLLRLPTGQINVHILREQQVYAPLRQHPRFETVMNDPANNAPLF